MMEREEFLAQPDKLKAVDKILGSPVIAQFDEQTTKLRTNLIIASAVSIALCLADLHISPDSRILGLKFAGLTDTLIRNALLAIVAYMSLHFIWNAGDGFMEWRLRITGTRAAFVPQAMWTADHHDSPSDPRQSTLYNWWKEQASRMGNMSIAEINARLDRWEKKLDERLSNTSDWSKLAQAMLDIRDVARALKSLQDSIDLARRIYFDARVPMSLERFDKWFEIFLRSQNLRWLVIDAAAPIVFAGWALYLLSGR